MTFLSIDPDELQEGLLEIAGARYHHLVRVRRLAVGALLCATLPDGRIYRAEIVDITGRSLRARVLGEEQPTGISPCHITLAQAVLKGDKMETVVQKATELGVRTLIPIRAARSIPRWTPEQADERVARWQRVAEGAAEQSERSLPLHITPIRSLADALRQPASLRIVLSERGGQTLRTLAARYPILPAVTLFLGPEGGWSEEEMTAFMADRVEPLHLGRRILRAETASLVAVALAQYHWGDLATPGDAPTRTATPGPP